MIKVISHKSPDTDCVCSTIIYSWFLNQKGTESIPTASGKLNKETEYVLEKFGVGTPEKISAIEENEKVIIVDTNNPDELVSGIQNAEILEIIDHHKLVGGLSTSSTIKVTIRPVASTATLLWEIIKQDGIEVDKNIAGLILSSILSDTLKFTSPTTTDEDKKAVEELVKITSINIDEHSTKMFEAKSSLEGMSAKDILLVDSKVYELGDKKVRISVLETTNPQNSLDMSEELKKEMGELIKIEELDNIFFFAVDILNTESTLLAIRDEDRELAKKAFGGEFDNNAMKLEGIVSRKKQMVPKFEEVI